MSGNDIGADKPSIRKSRQPAAEPLAFERQDDRRKAERRKPHQAFCGAMSQQRDDSGTQSVPQKLLQLVGCRDPKAYDPKADDPKPTDPKARTKVRTKLKR